MFQNYTLINKFYVRSIYVLCQVGIAAKCKIKCNKFPHEKKLEKFRQRQLNYIAIVLGITLKTLPITFHHKYFQVRNEL